MAPRTSRRANRNCSAISLPRVVRRLLPVLGSLRMRRLHLPTVRRLYGDLATRAETEGMAYRTYLETQRRKGGAGLLRASASARPQRRPSLTSCGATP
jgi:hypothetical protein